MYPLSTPVEAGNIKCGIKYKYFIYLKIKDKLQFSASVIFLVNCVLFCLIMYIPLAYASFIEMWIASLTHQI